MQNRTKQAHYKAKLRNKVRNISIDISRLNAVLRGQKHLSVNQQTIIQGLEIAIKQTMPDPNDAARRIVMPGR